MGPYRAFSERTETTIMTPRIEGWNVVIAGHWNRMIFTPEWVGENLFQARKEIETLVALLPKFPLIYRDELVILEVSESRITVRPRVTDDGCLVLAERMAHKILSLLNNTPILGVGINFAFSESAPPDNLSSLFNIEDDSQLGSSGWDIQERRITRKMVRDGAVLNLSLVYGKDGVNFEFNFHTDTTNNDVAKNAVAERAIHMKDSAIHMLDEIYRLQVMAEGANNE